MSNQFFGNELNCEVSDELVKYLRNIDLLLIIYFLKNTTDRQHALSVNEIIEQISDYFIPITVDNKDKKRNSDDRLLKRSTTNTTINTIMYLYESKDPFDIQLCKLLTAIFGGRINSIAASTSRISKGSKQKYYFEPLLSQSDLDMVKGAIESSTYLSAEEKSYLTNGISIINPLADYRKEDLDDTSILNSFCIDGIKSFPKKPRPDKAKQLPVNASTLLTHINLIKEAIDRSLKIDIVYGEYAKNETGHIVFCKKRDEIMTLNPYAMFWNRGQYYLVATKPSDKKIWHLRVDRIFSVCFTEEIAKNGAAKYSKRDKIPTALDPFFTTKNRKKYFDSIKFTSTYPNMYFHEDTRLVDCEFACTSSTISLLVDAFGTDIKVTSDEIANKQKEFDRNGIEIKHYIVRVSNVQYDNAIKYALNRHETVTLLRAYDIANDMQEIDASKDIEEGLKASLRKYQEIKKKYN